MGLRERLSEAVISGDSDVIFDLVDRALQQGLSVREIIREGLLVGMQHVGEEFKEGEMFIPEVLMAAETMNRATDTLRPHMVEGDLEPAGLVVLGTVEGDLHDIGKNLVRLMLESHGFSVVDLGIDVSAEGFLRAAEEHSPDVLGMSALLTTTLSRMEEVVAACAEADLPDVKIIVGGAPVTEGFAESIGAEGYAPDAVSAVDLVKSLMDG